MAAASMRERPAEPIYLYAIVPAAHLGGARAPDADELGPGIRMIAEGPFAAVVGPGPGRALAGRSREELARLLLAHQKIVEAAMRRMPVLPVKFGTQAPDEASVRRALEQGRGTYEEAFAKLAGCIQMEVLVLWDLESVFREIAAEEAIVRLKSEFAAASECEADAARVTLGRLVKASLEDQRRKLALRLIPALSGVAVDKVENAIMDDRMVVNLALLISCDQAECLDRRLEELDAEHQGRLTLRCVGPLPPYSFATVELRFPLFAEVERARRILGLRERATVAELRMAYRRRVRAVHPDASGTSHHGDADMPALTEAYRILGAHAAGGANGHGEAEPLRFDQRAVSQRVSIAIRRQEPATAGSAAPTLHGG